MNSGIYEYSPIIKSAGFNPAPVAGNIPFFADSLNNPMCVGTKSYEDFWEEQLYYILYGYTTGGLFIPPKYYELLNFGMIDGAGGKGFVRPYFLDIHYELYMAEYEIRNDNSCAGLVIPKARRKALSFTEVQMMKYGMKYNESYRAGAAAGLATFADSLRNKLYRTYNLCPPELQVHHLTRGDDGIQIGYEEKLESGWQKNQTATVLFETMKDNSKKFEGEYFDDVFLEEAGEFPMAEETLISILPAMKDGMNFKGKVWCCGTGGSMQSGGKTFSNIWHNADHYNLRRMFIPAKRFYPPFVRRKTGDSLTPNLDALYPDLSPEQLLGCEDVEAAMKGLKEEANQLAQLPNKSKYIQFKQNMPETIEDVFVSSGNNKFDAEALYDQLYQISSLPSRKFVEYILDWKKDEKGDVIMPLEVDARVANEKDKDWQKVKVFQQPNPKYYNLDYGGCDTYDQDNTEVGTSLGGVIVVRRAKEIHNTEEQGTILCCTYYGRPPRKEQHWEIALLISAWYNLVGSMMIAAEREYAIKFFKDNFGKKYLAKRPKSFDAVDSKMSHEFGVKMTGATKPKMISIMQSWVVDDIKYCWSEELCNDLVAYDETNIGNDWDLADSLGLALIGISDSNRKVSTIETQKEQDSIFKLGQWSIGSDGNVVSGSGYQDEISKLFKSF